MASSDFLISEEALECSICGDVYVDKDPRSLPCQHTFCFECLETFVQSSQNLTCPECRAPFQVPQNDVIKLAKNLTCKKIKGRLPTENVSCDKHKKEGSLFCLSHSTSSICSECFYQNHLKCEVKPMKFKKDKLNEFLSKVEDEKAEINKKIEDKQKEMMKTVEHNLKKMKDELLAKANNKIEKITEMFNRENPFEENIKDVHNLMEKNLDPGIKDLRIEIKCVDGSKIVKTSNVCNFENLENDLCNLPENYEKRSYIFIKSSIVNNDQIFLPENPKFYNIYKSLMNYPHVTQFKCNFTRMTDQEFQDLCQSLQYSAANLTLLSFNGCNLSAKQGFRLGKLLEKCCSLENISLYSNKYLNKNISAICSGLNHSGNTLKHLNFSNCQLSCVDFLSVGMLLNFCSNISSFDISYNAIDEENLRIICNGLRKSQATLNTIDVSGCDLKNIENLKVLLKSCPELQNLNMKSNFEIICISFLWDPLKVSARNLRTLNFFNCKLSQNDAEYLGYLLKDCRIQMLNICMNPGIKGSLLYIIKSLQNSAYSLEELHFDTENLTRKQCSFVGQLLSNLKVLKYLTMTFNRDENEEIVKFGLSELSEELLNSSDALQEIRYTEYSLVDGQVKID